MSIELAPILLKLILLSTFCIIDTISCLTWLVEEHLPDVAVRVLSLTQIRYIYIYIYIYIHLYIYIIIRIIIIITLMIYIARWDNLSQRQRSFTYNSQLVTVRLRKQKCFKSGFKNVDTW